MKYFLIFYTIFFCDVFCNKTYAHQDIKTKEPIEKELEQFITNLYLKIIQPSPASTFPFEKKLTEKKIYNKTYNLICKDILNKICKTHKKTIKNTFKKLKKIPNLQEHPKTLEESTKETASTYIKYRKKFIKLNQVHLNKIKTTIEQEQTSQKKADNLLHYYNNTQTKQIENFNLELKTESFEKKHYHFATKYISNLIKGASYDLEDIDTINATKELIENLKKIFICKTSTLKKCSKKEIYIYENIINDNKSSYEETKETNHNNIETYVLDKLVGRYALNDSEIVNLIFLKSYQRAIWKLREKHLYQAADFLEEFVIETAFNQENIINIENLKLGFSKTYITTCNESLRGVYKPKVSFLKHPCAYISSNYKAEVAAYFLDKLLNLNMVPLTHFAQYDSYQKGSHQYFVEDSYRARIMSIYNGEKTQKFGTGQGRAKKTNDLIFFDWLIDNWDRNTDNYLILPEGKIVLIDHGFSFFIKKSFKNLSNKRLLTLNPSKKLLEKIKKIHTNNKILDPLIAIIGEKTTQRIKNKINIYANQHSSNQLSPFY